MSLVIGSVALQWMVSLDRKPLDLDLIAFPEEIPELVVKYRPTAVNVNDENHLVLHDCAVDIGAQNNIVEIEIAWPGSTGEDILLSYPTKERYFASMYDLYWLKMSHRFKKDTPHFEKTRNDIMALRAARYSGFFYSEPGWYKRRLEETLNHNHPKLNTGQTKENFFNGDGVKYYFDHDWIHEVVARMYGGTKPAYLSYQADGEEVKCDRSKFDALPFQERLRGVMEEATVLALERSQIPRRLDETFSRSVTPEWSYKYALQKVCTSITSGWFREFAWENYGDALSCYAKDYVERFWQEAREDCDE